MLDHWASLGWSDGLTLLYWIVLLIAVIVSNNLFADFVASKPEGRKTAIGQYFQASYTALWLKFCSNCPHELNGRDESMA